MFWGKEIAAQDEHLQRKELWAVNGALQETEGVSREGTGGRNMPGVTCQIQMKKVEPRIMHRRRWLTYVVGTGSLK